MVTFDKDDSQDQIALDHASLTMLKQFVSFIDFF